MTLDFEWTPGDDAELMTVDLPNIGSDSEDAPDV
jgi:hypothetical protein